MLTHNSLTKASDALSEGFFADEVVKSLRRQEPVNTERKTLLLEVEKYVDQIQKGREQVSTGRLSDDALASNAAYGRLLRFIIRQRPDTKDISAIQRFIEAIRTEVEEALRSGRIDPDRLQKTRGFFQYVREASLHDSASTFGWERVDLLEPIGVP